MTATDDGYSGHVEQDGPWQDRRDGGLLVRKLSVGPMDNNVYVVACARTRAAFLVDAANRAGRLREALAGFEPVAVLQTHGHGDHVGAWHDLRSDPGLPIWGHANDRDLYPGEPDRLLEDGERIAAGDLEVAVIHTPGHTPGGLQFLVRADERPHLFSGDSLFPGGLGNTWGDPERFQQLHAAVTSKVFDQLEDDTWVYPGHGDDTTLGKERPSLGEWLQRGW